MLQNTEIAITDFVRMTPAGVQIATYTQVRAALIKRYKEVYGSNIDVSTGTADGVFINDLALIINNILQGMNALYSNLNVDEAAGIYLDRLCALSNVRRKQATHSTAVINVENNGSANYSLTMGTLFVDQAGSLWIYEGNTQTIAVGANIDITVKAEDEGEIVADTGWIVSTVEVTQLTITQNEAATVGQNEETDAELRARRAKSLAPGSATILESLISSLFELGSVKDVKVYNNNTATAIDGTTTVKVKDGSTVAPYSIYPILRLAKGVTPNNDAIAKVIHNMMTPGIATKVTAGTGVTLQEVTISTEIPGTMTVNEVIKWKNATPVKPTIVITLTELTYFSNIDIVAVGKSIIETINAKPIGEDLTNLEIIIDATNADPHFKNMSTYLVSDVTINGSSNDYTNPDTYFDYTTISYNSSNHKLTLS